VAEQNIQGDLMTYLVGVYDCAQQFGGPEEGGWWYDSGDLVRVVGVYHSHDKAMDHCCKLNQRLRSRVFGPNKGKHEYTSVVSEGEVSAMVWENRAPEHFPNRRPHYE
jgi:hypothetical protein